MKKIPKQWKDHEPYCRKRILEWLKQNAPDSIKKLAWDIAGEVHNMTGGIMIYTDFNERKQRFFLQKGFADWLEKIGSEVEHAYKIGFLSDDERAKYCDKIHYLPGGYVLQNSGEPSK